MKSLLIVFLLTSIPVFAQETFTLSDEGKKIEGFLALPGSQPKALILYFHRGVEDRTAVMEWGKVLNPSGYAVAGYTRTKTKNFLTQATGALQELRKRNPLASIPCIAMGASMGTPEAAELFASSPQIKGLILLVPGSDNICKSFSQANGRPVLMIYAENDEIVDRTTSKELIKCLPKTGAIAEMLPGQSHRFPPSLISNKILQWLDTNVMKPQTK
jgi:dienelactone hydrolase